MKLIALREVARRAGCSESNIRRLRLAGRMPAAVEKAGQTYMFSEAAIERWLPTRHRQWQGRPEAKKGRA